MAYIKKYSSIIFLMGLLLLYTAVVCVTQQIPFQTGIIFLLFQVFGVFVPGAAVNVALKTSWKESTTFFVVSYATGLIILLIQYLLLASLKLSAYSWILSMAIMIASGVYLYRRRKEIHLEQNRTGWIICICFFALILVIDFFTVVCVNRMPSENTRSSFYVDLLFWVGNSISFMKSFPVQDFRLCGESFNYHYFSSILMAQSSFITKINVIQLCLYFSNISSAVLMAFGGFTLFKSLIKRNVLVIWALAILFLTDGSIASGMWHLFFCPFGYDYATGFGMLSFFLLIQFAQKERYRLGEIILSALFIAMTTGCKGPIGIVVLAGYGVFAIVLLVRGRWKEGIVSGTAWLAAFLLTYLVFIQGDITAGGAGLQILGIPKTFWATPWTREMYDSLSQRWGIGGILLKVMLEILFIFLQNIPAVCLLVISGCCLAKCLIKKKMDIYLLLILCTGVTGILLTLCTYQGGGSQTYFVCATFPTAILGGFYGVDKYGLPFEKWGRYLAVALGVLLSLHGGKIAINRNIIPMAEKGIARLSGKDLNEIGYPYIDLTREDLEAYSWIRNNSGTNDIIAVDTFYITETGRLQNMAAGVFAERYVWNDGKYSTDTQELERRQALIQRVVEGDESAIEELQAEGVHYFLQTLGEYPNAEYPMECVFHNDSFKIYLVE